MVVDVNHIGCSKMTGECDDMWICFMVVVFFFYFLFFKKLFLILTYKNDLKIYKKLILNKKLIF
jgi:hypothetical protein